MAIPFSLINSIPLKLPTEDPHVLGTNVTEMFGALTKAKDEGRMDSKCQVPAPWASSQHHAAGGKNTWQRVDKLRYLSPVKSYTYLSYAQRRDQEKIHMTNWPHSHKANTPLLRCASGAAKRNLETRDNAQVSQDANVTQRQNPSGK